MIAIATLLNAFACVLNVVLFAIVGNPASLFSAALSALVTILLIASRHAP